MARFVKEQEIFPHGQTQYVRRGPEILLSESESREDMARALRGEPTDSGIIDSDAFSGPFGVVCVRDTDGDDETTKKNTARLLEEQTGRRVTTGRLV
jgi:hypothetical protein